MNETYSDELTASISDVGSVYEDDAQAKAEERIRAKYNDEIGRWKPLSLSTYKPFKRAHMYFFRETMKEKEKKKELLAHQTNGIDLYRQDLTAAADRHERMKAEWNNQADADDQIKTVLSAEAA